MLDFVSCNINELKNADHSKKEFAVATNEGLCFVKIMKSTANYEIN
jgi:hypothetical protein